MSDLRRSQVRSGTVLSYVNIGMTILIAFFFVPFMIRMLGQAEYGLYTLIGSFIGYFTLFDFGLSATIVRYVTKYRVSGDKEEEQVFLGMVLVFYTAVALLVLVVGFILAGRTAKIFGGSLSADEIEKAQIMLGIVVVSFAVSLPSRVYHGILSGYEQFNIMKLIPMVRALLRVAICAAVLKFGYGAVVLTLVEAALTIAAASASVFYVRFRMGIRIRIRSFSSTLLSRLLSFSFYIFIGSLVDQINFRLDNLLLGIMVGTQAVALYGLASNLIIIFREIIGVIGEAIRPRVMVLAHGNAPKEELIGQLVRAGRLQYILLGGLYLGFLLFGRLFIRLWVAPEFLEVWLFVVIIMFPLIVTSGYSAVNYILHAWKRVRFLAFSSILIGVLNILISILLIRRLGPLGAVIGTAAAYTVGNIIILNWYIVRKVRLPMRKFYAGVFRGIGWVFLLSGAAGLFIRMIPGESWLVFFSQCVLFTLIYGLLMFRIGTNSEERALFSSLLVRLRPIRFGRRH